jgi:hypothetical protein
MLEEIRRVAQDDLAHVAMELADLEHTAEDQDAYYHAVGLHHRAEELLPSIQSVEDARAVAKYAADARRAIAAVRRGIAIDDHAAPCFFDPRHGPSARDGLFAPEGGALRPVPACEACAEELDAGRLPPIRRVLVNGHPQPYWRSPAHVGYAGRGGNTTIDDLIEAWATNSAIPVTGAAGLGLMDLVLDSLTDW